MRDPIELLIELYTMYDNGELASEYDTKRNKMINSLELIAIMEEVEELIPEALTPIEAAREGDLTELNALDSRVSSLGFERECIYI